MYKSFPMPKKIAILALIAILAFFIVLVFASFNPFQEKIEIALVSPLSNIDPTKLEIGQNNVDAINLYLKSVNKAGGINGKKVVLSVYDDQVIPKSRVRLPIGSCALRRWLCSVTPLAL